MAFRSRVDWRNGTAPVLPGYVRLVSALTLYFSGEIFVFTATNS